MSAQWTPPEAAVEVAARAMFKHHCGPDADLDASNARVPELIYNAETDEDEPFDPADWEPYLTDLWEGWARAALTAARGPLVAEVREEIAREIEVGRQTEPDDLVSALLRSGVEKSAQVRVLAAWHIGMDDAARLARGADQ
jgi:hypothetical protein